MMKHLYIFIIIFSSISLAYSQVGINTINPNESAILDISSSNQGVLFPRMDLGILTEAAPVNNPQESLMVWNTDAANGGMSKGFYYWDKEWKPFGSHSSSELTGVFGKLTLNSDINSSLNRYNSTFLTSPSSGSSSGVTLNNAQSAMRVQVDGLYKVTYTITYQKNNNSGANTIEFFLHENNNSIAASRKTFPLFNNKNSITHTIDINLRADQTYGIGFSRSNQSPNNVPITVYSDKTEFSIQRL